MEKQKEQQVVRITVEYSDGTIREATGKKANIIMEHWVSCEMMSFNHGQKYKGPFLEIKKK
jgi:hypothetical protein